MREEKEGFGVNWIEVVVCGHTGLWNEQAAAANEVFVPETPKRKLCLACAFADAEKETFDNLTALTCAEE